MAYPLKLLSDVLSSHFYHTSKKEHEIEDKYQNLQAGLTWLCPFLYKMPITGKRRSKANTRLHLVIRQEIFYSACKDKNNMKTLRPQKIASSSESSHKKTKSRKITMFYYTIYHDAVPGEYRGLQ